MEPFPLHRYVADYPSHRATTGAPSAARSELARQRSRGLAPLLTLGHLAHSSRVPYDFLRSVVARKTEPYARFLLPGRAGKVREILVPSDRLKLTQRWILRNVLDLQPVHPSCFSYRKGRSAVECATEHIGARWMLKTDIRSFFPSIDEVSVYRVFTDIGYQPLVSFELSRLCTWTGPAMAGVRNQKAYAISEYSQPHLGVLPQGAPTSGMLSNLVMRDVDEELSRLARSHDAVYTRYSDDMAFSGTHRKSSGVEKDLFSGVKATLASKSLRINEGKTRFIPPGQRKVILGTLVKEHGVDLLPDYRRRTEVLIRAARQFGLENAAVHWGFDSSFHLIEHMDGRIAFAEGVNPKWAARQHAAWEAALVEGGYLPPQDTDSTAV